MIQVKYNHSIMHWFWYFASSGWIFSLVLSEIQGASVILYLNEV